MTAPIATSPKRNGTMSARADIRPGRDNATQCPIVAHNRTSVAAGALRTATGWRIADGVLAVGVLAVVVTAGNLDHMPHGLRGFLEIRLTIKNALLVTAFAWGWPIVLTLCGLYAPNRLRTGRGEWPRLVIAGAVGCALAMVFPLTSRSGLVGPLHAFLFGATVVPATGLLRASVRAVNHMRRLAARRQVVLVGSGPLAAELYRQLVSDASQDTTVIGFIDSEPQAALRQCSECQGSGAPGTGPAHLGGVPDLERVLMRRVVDNVFIGLPLKSRYEEVRQSMAACARVGVPASYSADLFGRGPTIPHPDDRGAPVLSLPGTPFVDRFGIKRVIDVAGALVLLIVLAPVLLGIAIAIKLTSTGPVLYPQDRYGYMKRLFRMYKFRTMVVDAEQLQLQLEVRNEASGPVFKIRDDPRITPTGRFLRRWSLDELPQLWNVLAGEMSLVGPRPLPTRDVGRFTEPWLMRRFSVQPGLTCLWQINGRSDVGFDRWIALDLEYIDRWSLWLDLRIMLRTIPAVFRGAGAS